MTVMRVLLLLMAAGAAVYLEGGAPALVAAVVALVAYANLECNE